MVSSRKVFICSAGLVLLLGVFSSHKLDPKNPPTGQTGAPSETTCSTASGCHFGGNFSGHVTLTGIPDTIEANKDYTLSLKLTSTCLRTGFELTVLDGSNKKCGDLTAGTNCSLRTAGTRQYIRQANPINLSGGSATYSFKWKSPATILSDSARFYYVMLQANGNGGTSGDNVAKGLKKVVLQTVSATQNENVIGKITIYPNPTSDYFTLTLPQEESAQISITDKSGKNIFSSQVEGSKVIDIRNLSPDMYFVRITGKTFKTTKTVIKTEKE